MTSALLLPKKKLFGLFLFVDQVRPPPSALASTTTPHSKRLQLLFHVVKAAGARTWRVWVTKERTLWTSLTFLSNFLTTLVFRSRTVVTFQILFWSKTAPSCSPSPPSPPFCEDSLTLDSKEPKDLPGGLTHIFSQDSRSENRLADLPPDPLSSPSLHWPYL